MCRVSKKGRENHSRNRLQVPCHLNSGMGAFKRCGGCEQTPLAATATFKRSILHVQTQRLPMTELYLKLHWVQTDPKKFLRRFPNHINFKLKNIYGSTMTSKSLTMSKRLRLG